jgi:hypothetical protein
MVPVGSELETHVEAEPNRVSEAAGLSDSAVNGTVSIYFSLPIHRMKEQREFPIVLSVAQ